jgi:hypothetical protein
MVSCTNWLVAIKSSLALTSSIRLFQILLPGSKSRTVFWNSFLSVMKHILVNNWPDARIISAVSWKPKGTILGFHSKTRHRFSMYRLFLEHLDLTNAIRVMNDPNPYRGWRYYFSHWSSFHLAFYPECVDILTIRLWLG